MLCLETLGYSGVLWIAEISLQFLSLFMEVEVAVCRQGAMCSIDTDFGGIRM